MNRLMIAVILATALLPLPASAESMTAGPVVEGGMMGPKMDALMQQYFQVLNDPSLSNEEKAKRMFKLEQAMKKEQAQQSQQANEIATMMEQMRQQESSSSQAAPITSPSVAVAPSVPQSLETPSVPQSPIWNTSGIGEIPKSHFSIKGIHLGSRFSEIASIIEPRKPVFAAYRPEKPSATFTLQKPFGNQAVIEELLEIYGEKLVPDVVAHIQLQVAPRQYGQRNTELLPFDKIRNSITRKYGEPVKYNTLLKPYIAVNRQARRNEEERFQRANKTYDMYKDVNAPHDLSVYKNPEQRALVRRYLDYLAGKPYKSEQRRLEVKKRWFKRYNPAGVAYIGCGEGAIKAFYEKEYGACLPKYIERGKNGDALSQGCLLWMRNGDLLRACPETGGKYKISLTSQRVDKLLSDFSQHKAQGMGKEVHLDL